MANVQITTSANTIQKFSSSKFSTMVKLQNWHLNFNFRFNLTVSLDDQSVSYCQTSEILEFTQNRNLKTGRYGLIKNGIHIIF